MKCAIVELKYMPKKFVIVPIENVKDYKPKFSPVEDFFCYISNDLSEEPNFDAKYKEKMDGEPGRYKVFIRKVTEAAIAYLKNKRIPEVAKKFRASTNTDTELTAEETKRKRNEKRILKCDQENANIMNTSHLAGLVTSQSNSSTASKYKTLVDGLFIDSDSEKENEVITAAATSEIPTEVKVFTPNTTNKVAVNKIEPNQKIVLKPKKKKVPIPLSVCNPSHTQVKTDVAINKIPTQVKVFTPGIAKKIPISSSSAVNKIDPNQKKIPNQKQKGPVPLSICKSSCTQVKTDVTTNKIPTQVKVFTLGTANKVPISSSSAKPNQKTVFIPKEKEHIPLSACKTSKPSQTKIITNKVLPQIKVYIPSTTSKVPESSDENKIQETRETVLISQGQISSLGKASKPLPLPSPDLNTNKNSKNSSQQLKPITAHRKIEINETQLENYPSALSESTMIESQSCNANRKRLANASENNSKKKKQIEHSSVLPNQQLGMAETNKKLKKEVTQLKNEVENLTQRNIALQNALVICTKEIPQPLTFEEKDGGRLYTCGIFLNKTQCNILDAIKLHRPFCNNLILAVFGSDTLKASSVTGAASNRTKGPAKPALCSTSLKFIYDMMAIRTNNSPLYTPQKINRIINRKISNLLAVGRPRGASRGEGNDDGEKEFDGEDSDDEYDGEGETEVDMENVNDEGETEHNKGSLNEEYDDEGETEVDMENANDEGETEHNKGYLNEEYNDKGETEVDMENLGDIGETELDKGNLNEGETEVNMENFTDEGEKEVYEINNEVDAVDINDTINFELLDPNANNTIGYVLDFPEFTEMLNNWDY